MKTISRRMTITVVVLGLYAVLCVAMLVDGRRA